MKISEAAELGIDRIRLACWALPEDHLKIDLLKDGTHGPWVHLYSPLNALLGRKNPQTVLWSDIDEDRDDWEAWRRRDEG